MGLCQSEEEKTQTKQSRAIDKKMKEGALQDEKVIKLLLLGAGESGKSTLLKQMRFVKILIFVIRHDFGCISFLNNLI